MKTEKGAWFAGSLFSEVDTAFRWHISPSAFFALSQDDRALMMAYCNVTTKMAAFERKKQEIEMNKRAKYRGKK